MITETEIIYENIQNKLFQIIGIDDTNKCIIKEVGHFSDINKNYNVLIHQMKITECDIKIYTPIYKINEIDNMRLIIMEIQILHNNEIIGLNQFCFISDDIHKTTFMNKENNENIGHFVIYDAIDNKIIKKYEKYIGQYNILNELICSIE